MAKKKSLIESIFGIYVAIVWIMVIPKMVKNPLMGVFLLFAYIGIPPVAFFLYKKRGKIAFFNSRNSLEKLRNLRPDEFEEFVAHMFHRLGYETERVGGAYDGGIDVVAKKDGVTQYIQCKKFITRNVSVDDMRSFYGAITDKLTDAKAFFITTNIFTLEAEKFAEGKPIELIDGKKLMEYVRLSGIEVPNLNRPVFGSMTQERCPWCGASLVLRTAKKGANTGHAFYGCMNYPKCRYIKNISR